MANILSNKDQEKNKLDIRSMVWPIDSEDDEDEEEENEDEEDGEEGEDGEDKEDIDEDADEDNRTDEEDAEVKVMMTKIKLEKVARNNKRSLKRVFE
ncbi:hypothetical protein G6F23_010941 [Rhizopus arrhizus]|nr:hypothetical protein G6F23_010941 [Rhizopus arrhizus]